MKYETRPVSVDIEQWVSADELPEGVHDPFLGFQNTPTAYIEDPTDSYIIRLGEYVVRYPDGKIEVYVEEDIDPGFRKIE